MAQENTSKTPAGLRLEDLLKQVKGQKHPPVEKWNPEFCGDIDMVIKKDGTWFYMGTPIGRKAMVKLFSSILRKDADGKTYLVTPVEKVGIVVEDAPFLAVGMEILGSGKDSVVSFVTNVGDTVVVDKDHPLRIETDPKTKEPRPYVRVRGNLDALIVRSVFYEMVDKAEQKAGCLGLWSSGAFYSMGQI